MMHDRLQSSRSFYWRSWKRRWSLRKLFFSRTFNECDIGVDIIKRTPYNQCYSTGAMLNVTYVSNWIRLVSTSGLVVVVVVAVDKAASFSPLAVVSPFSFVLVSDLCDPDEEHGRSLSSGFGCISVNGNSATSSLKNTKNICFTTRLRYRYVIRGTLSTKWLLKHAVL